ncbi:MAG: biopolymer transporter ExbD [Verrucomicrobia bacterium]|nr:biopolymer transporter ExbD [Verrucomicrobiota bacterium]MBV9657305.1 biopolymer transporter ExbD [Verrucomicrobiota bacterium]
MQLRQRVRPPPILGFQVTPMIDVFCCLLIFFIVTYNFSRNETALEVKVPTAKEGKETRRSISECILNVRADGSVILNRQTLNLDQLKAKLAQLSQLYPDQAVILRGDEAASYKVIVDVLDVCRAANVWNVAFATAKPPTAASESAR